MLPGFEPSSMPSSVPSVTSPSPAPASSRAARRRGGQRARQRRALRRAGAQSRRTGRVLPPVTGRRLLGMPNDGLACDSNVSGHDVCNSEATARASAHRAMVRILPNPRMRMDATHFYFFGGHHAFFHDESAPRGHLGAVRTTLSRLLAPACRSVQRGPLACVLTASSCQQARGQSGASPHAGQTPPRWVAGRWKRAGQLSG